MSVAYSITSSKQFESYTDLRVSLGFVGCIRNDDDDVIDGTDDDDSSVMTSYLLVGYRADRGNPEKGSQRGPQRSENHTGINRLISWKEDLNGGTVTLPMSGAP